MQNGIPKFFKNEPKEPDPKYVLKETFEQKISEIETTLGKKALKEEIPTIPDHSIYALKEEIPTDYKKMRGLVASGRLDQVFNAIH